MRFCPKCGKEVTSSHRTCFSCGSPLDWKDSQLTDSVTQLSNTLLPNELRTDELATLSVGRRIGRAVDQHRGTSLAIAIVSFAVVAVLAIVLVTRSTSPDCYSTAFRYGDLARRVDYNRIPEIRNRVNIEVEDDELRHAAQVVIDFVATAKTFGGAEYPTRSELDNFARNYCFANDL